MALVAPGNETVVEETGQSAYGDGDTGTAFMTGFTLKGPVVGTPPLLRNMDDKERHYGGRSAGYELLHDAIEAYFKSGGRRLYLNRVVGPNPTKATINIPDALGTTLVATAKNPGEWASGIQVVISDVTGDTFVVTLLDSDGNVIAGPSEPLAGNAAALAWADGNLYLDFSDSAGAQPIAGTYTLAGGTDDKANANDDTWNAAVNRAAKGLGPGQVAMPGRGTAAALTDMLEHAVANNRVVIPDLPDAGPDPTLATAATWRAANNDSLSRLALPVWPWAKIPGVARGASPRVIPWSAVQMGMIADSEARGNTSNKAVAGKNGTASYVVGLSQDPISDSDRGQLNTAGVNVALLRNGEYQMYGYRSLVNPNGSSEFLQFSATRTFMGVAADCGPILDSFSFEEFDGKGLKMAELKGELIGAVKPYYEAKALFGASPGEAFVVDTSPAVNPIEEVIAGRVRAKVYLKVSPFAEFVTLILTKVRNTEVLA